jgi:hypothetical protein
MGCQELVEGFRPWSGQISFAVIRGVLSLGAHIAVAFVRAELESLNDLNSIHPGVCPLLLGIAKSARFQRPIFY